MSLVLKQATKGPPISNICLCLVEVASCKVIIIKAGGHLEIPGSDGRLRSGVEGDGGGLAAAPRTK